MAQNRPRNTKANNQPQSNDPAGLIARKIAAKLLGSVLDEKKNLDALIDPQHGDTAYNALIDKDRALIRAILMICLRRKGQIDDALSKVLDRNTPKNATHLTHSLSVAAAQILFLDIPDSAAVNLAVTAIAKDRRTSRFANLANAILRRLSREKDDILNTQNVGKLCMPAWFFKRLRQSYGKERAGPIADLLCQEAALDLTVKSSPEEWAEKFSGIVLPNGTVRLKPKGPIPDMEGYDEGEWWVQDAAATLPAGLLGDVSGLTIADLCAAPGGKTAQLAHSGAKVTAVELSTSRQQRLKGNLERLHLTAELVNADILEWQVEHLFDAVLLDAPCSSTGTVRRHPDILWTKSAEDISTLAELQFKMWNKAVDFAKPGGLIVFSNCSLDREEGENLHAKMLATRNDIEPVPILAAEVPGLEDAITGQGTLRTLPVYYPNSDFRLAGVDGFFASRLRRK